MFILENEDTNSDTILIPQTSLIQFYNNLYDNYLILQIKNGDNIHIFSNISSNETSDIIYVPNWVLNKLGANNLDEVELKQVYNLDNVEKIYLQGTNSKYANESKIKEKIESYFLNSRVANFGDVVIIPPNYEFYIVKLENDDGMEINRGKLVGNDVKLEFMKPYDVLEEERLEEKKKLEEEQKEQAEQEKFRLERLGKKTVPMNVKKEFLYPELLKGLVFGRSNYSRT